MWPEPSRACSHPYWRCRSFCYSALALTAEFLCGAAVTMALSRWLKAGVIQQTYNSRRSASVSPNPG